MHRSQSSMPRSFRLGVSMQVLLTECLGSRTLELGHMLWCCLSLGKEAGPVFRFYACLDECTSGTHELKIGTGNLLVAYGHINLKHSLTDSIRLPVGTR